MFITLELLTRLNACRTQKKAFAQDYPNGVELTADNIEHAYKRGLAAGWLYYRLPSEYRGLFFAKQRSRPVSVQTQGLPPGWAEDLAAVYAQLKEDELIPSFYIEDLE